MTRIANRPLVLCIVLTSALGLSGCTSSQVIDTSVGAAAGTTKVAAKGAVGAGKLVYRGGRWVVRRDTEDD